jgi:hypothetical protein
LKPNDSAGVTRGIEAVRRIWAKHGLKPHPRQRYMTSDDPDFDAKAADINQVEIWFSKIERDVIARGVFTSVTDLKRKLMRYIRKYNDLPKPVKWVDRNPTRRIATDSAVTGH